MLKRSVVTRESRGYKEGGSPKKKKKKKEINFESSCFHVNSFVASRCKYP